MSTEQIEFEIAELDRQIKELQKRRGPLVTALAKSRESDAVCKKKVHVKKILNLFKQFGGNGYKIQQMIPRIDDTDYSWLEFVTKNHNFIVLCILIAGTAYFDASEKSDSYEDDDEPLIWDENDQNYDANRNKHRILLKFVNGIPIPIEGMVVMKDLICKASVTFYYDFQLKGLVEFEKNRCCDADGGSYTVNDGLVKPSKCGSCQDKISISPMVCDEYTTQSEILSTLSIFAEYPAGLYSC